MVDLVLVVVLYPLVKQWFCGIQTIITLVVGNLETYRDHTRSFLETSLGPTYPPPVSGDNELFCCIHTNLSAVSRSFLVFLVSSTVKPFVFRGPVSASQSHAFASGSLGSLQAAWGAFAHQLFPFHSAPKQPKDPRIVQPATSAGHCLEKRQLHQTLPH